MPTPYISGSLAATKSAATVSGSGTQTLAAGTNDVFTATQAITTTPAVLDMTTIIEPVLGVHLRNAGLVAVQLAADAAFTTPFALLLPGGIAVFAPAGQVYARTLAGTASLTVTAAGIEAGSPPAAPSGFTAAWTEGVGTQLSWTDNSTDETGFEIYRNYERGTFATLYTTAADATSYVDEVAYDRHYGYRIRAVNASGASDWVDHLPIPPYNMAPVRMGGGGLDQTNNGRGLPFLLGGGNPSQFYSNEIWRAIDGDWQLLTTIPGDYYYWSDTEDLSSYTGLMCQYRVRTNSVSFGDTAWSNEDGDYLTAPP